jgi:hypothetical protein
MKDRGPLGKMTPDPKDSFWLGVVVGAVAASLFWGLAIQDPQLTGFMIIIGFAVFVIVCVVRIIASVIRLRRHR